MQQQQNIYESENSVHGTKIDLFKEKDLHYSIEEEPDDKESDDYNQSEEIEAESCESCGEMFDDIEDLIDLHIGLKFGFEN